MSSKRKRATGTSINTELRYSIVRTDDDEYDASHSDQIHQIGSKVGVCTDLDSDYDIYVTTEDRVISACGFMIPSTFNSPNQSEILPSNSIFVNYFVVDPSWQYRGVGTFMLRTLERKAMSMGLDSTILTVGNYETPDANHFWKSRGFASGVS